VATPDGRTQVAVGVIFHPQGDRVLLARRPPHVPHGGLWEFPGGKRHAGESREAALGRELLEELNIVVEEARPLIAIDHDYPGASVHLDVWRVTAYRGEPCGREGQELAWVPVSELRAREFPAANRPIVSALELPPLFLVTPDLDDYGETFFRAADTVLAAGVRLLQFRSRRLDDAERAGVIGRLAQLCIRHGARLLVNGPAGEALTAGAHGIHLTASRLLQSNERPLGPDHVVSASCHNQAELIQAARLGLDFVVLGPVCATGSHPGAEPLGWTHFAGLVAGARLPVYALGGLGPGDTPRARAAGAQGVAMISGIWAAPSPGAAVLEVLSAG
jgi:8-oxo-dGTP diphosphatase